MKKTSGKAVFLGAALLLAANYLVINRSTPATCCLPLPLATSAVAAEKAKSASTKAPAKASLPRLVDLGADKCIPCKMMMPVLADLKTNYLGQLEVEFIDVWKNPDAGKAFNINLIPTQIFYDAAGKERFRHEGFFSKKDILAKWQELGVQLKSEGRNPKAEVQSPQAK